MKVVSFNVNSVRIRLHQLKAVIDNHSPDIIGLQETKVTDEEFPFDEIRELGYEAICHGQKTHYGVALLSRVAARSPAKGFIWDDDDVQRRFVSGDFTLEDGRTLTVMNGYFPQGENRSHPQKFPNKVNFYASLNRLLREQYDPDNPVIVMGDMNVAPLDLDIGIGEPNRKRWLKDGKCSFLPEEREWLQQVMDWGMFDTFRAHHPETDDLFSWFDYRSRGFEREPRRGLRIDLILASNGLQNICTDAGIDYDVRAMDKPSDHCPIWTAFDTRITG
ncbi:MAG: exodeoxyribonuclease III [Pseudomonadales bacterium]|nr:exodeoxyribonuclease III [Pseudomonadales bacterium]